MQSFYFGESGYKSLRHLCYSKHITYQVVSKFIAVGNHVFRCIGFSPYIQTIQQPIARTGERSFLLSGAGAEDSDPRHRERKEIKRGRCKRAPGLQTMLIISHCNFIRCQLYWIGV